jgi:glycosyltransferase involved in cell wall biosynthesis
MTDPSLPFVSVVMPVRNEAAFISESLGAVLAQDYPADRMEVIVVDGDSTDGTQRVLERYQGSRPPVIVLSNPARVVPSALNIAIRKSRGEIIVRVDGHTVIAPDYVRKCVQFLKRGDAENVGGLMRPRGQSYFGQAAALATTCPFGIGNSRFHYAEEEGLTDTVYLGAYRREIFDRIGLFDEEFICNQDYELNYRLRAAGGRILCTPEIQSTYYCRESLSAIWRQYFSYGFWKVRTLRKHPRSLKARQTAAPAMVLGILVLLAVGFFFPPAWYLLALGAIFYLGLGSAFALRHSIAAGTPGLWFGVVLAFLAIHLAWGLGFWVGVWRALFRID